MSLVDDRGWLDAADAGSSSPLASPASAPVVRVALERREVGRRIAACAALLAILVAWMFLWPQTGDGDSIMHYLNARDGLHAPGELLGAWARWGFKLILLLPAQFGLVYARLTMAVLSALLVWQTMRLADDAKIPDALLAGPLLLFQPLVFALASDTMTELPMALGIVIALRLWIERRRGPALLLVSFLPTLRPEGFFLVALWGVLLVIDAARERSARPLLLAPLLGVGMIVWVGLCWGLSPGHDPLYFVHIWSWPAGSYRDYGRGSFFHHFYKWPSYCGPVLFPLFLLGLRRSMRREMALPWAVFGLVFLLHTVLYWRGWFASYGLMRILACVSPVTALVCLCGWNAIADGLARRGWGLAPRRVLAVATIALAGANAAIFYGETAFHYRCFAVRAVCNYVHERRLLEDAPALVMGEPMVVAELNLPPNPEHLLINASDWDEECARLKEQPIGTIGVWDNQHAREWFNVPIEDLPKLGYTVLYTVRQTVKCPALRVLGYPRAVQEQVYVVIRKDHDGKVPIPRD